ncbi:YoaK family protein [Novosphingobium huizhouense]|uniref:YoaK family protein n=1 Tax=Novosphingobium huizhouense TaxID=2866625 RepID=UPI001CD8A76E|nr:YoaK family protein [Novosphingobium huizhouense]
MLPRDRARRRFAIALAALAGFVDAVGFLSAGGYFLSFMSGNTTRLAVSLAVDPAHALLPALLIAGFVLGVAGGALLSLRAGRRRRAVLLLAVTLLLALAALARMAATPGPMLLATVLAMGAINNMFQRDGEVSIGLTYMTGALVKLGQGLAQRIARQARPGWWNWALLWAGLMAGAVSGAFAQDRVPAACLWIATAWALALVPVALVLPADEG